jgi:hypothetical protein
VLAVAAIACGGTGGGARLSAGGEPTAGIAAPLTTGVDTSEVGRAAYYAGEATRLRDIANQQRQLSAAYVRTTVPVASSKDWNAALKASADARAAAADQIATNLQALADFHTARAAAGGGQ